MSLTSFLKNDVDLRILIDRTFEKPEMTGGFERRAGPQTSNYALIGTAFDYVLRFKLEREYENVDSQPWVAQQGVTFGEIGRDDEDIDTDRPLQDILIDAQELHQEYLESGAMTDDLLAATLDLARLDWIYRSGRISDDFGQASEGDIRDLRQLYQIIPESAFTGADTVLLNPTFGSASSLVGGADADLVLDDSLIDIKTVKDAKLKTEYWRQLVGYALLADIASEELEHMPEFSELGIYFSRHGQLWQTSAERIYEHEKYEKFKSWFQDEAEEHFATPVEE